MKAYLSAVNLSASDNILKVWRVLQSTYPVMAQMEKNVLAISIFGVDVERLFSMARDVVIYRRNRFRRTIVDRIMLIKRIV